MGWYGQIASGECTFKIQKKCAGRVQCTQDCLVFSVISMSMKSGLDILGLAIKASIDVEGCIA